MPEKHHMERENPEPAKKKSRSRGGRRRGAKPAAAPASSDTPAAAASAASSSSSSPSSSSSSASSPSTGALFSSLKLIESSVRALRDDFQYASMTPIQELTLPHSLAGKDVLGQAKTGSGKTLAFLLPALENAARIKGASSSSRVTCLVLSPTRELALQIHAEAQRLLKHQASVSTLCLFGGVPIDRDRRAMAAAKGTLIIVGTPGRLNDHLTNTPHFSAWLGGIQTLVLDEFDHLLDMGFRPEIQKIVSHCSPVARRQTLLFSATLPPSLLTAAQSMLKTDYASVAAKTETSSSASSSSSKAAGDHDTVNLDISQSALVCELPELFPLLYAVIDEHRRTVPDHKIMVFFTTARVTQWAAALFQRAGLSVLEIHSRKSQAYRTSVSQHFREGSRLVLFSSDVSARGMDYPNVTLVVQLGLPSNREQYIHRIGRTARGGLTGHSLLLLASFEAAAFLSYRVPGIDGTKPHGRDLRAATDLLRRAAPAIDENTSASAYQSWLGFYNSFGRPLNLSKPDLVATANRYALESMWLPKQPMLFKQTIGKMGLQGVPGLLISPTPKPPAAGRGGAAARKPPPSRR